MLSNEETALIMALAEKADDHKQAQARALCEKITGLQESSSVASFGPPCENCGKPLRTPAAKVCACCWQRVR